MYFSIAITAKNCLDYTKAAVDSLRTSYPHQLIIVNDKSNDGTYEWLKELEHSWNREMPNFVNTESLTIIQNPDIDSLAGKWNEVMELASDLGSTAVLMCNNDILFAPYTIDTLVERMDLADESIGMVTANNHRDQMNPEDILTYPQPVPDASLEAENPDFSCFLMRVSAWRQIGKFDTNYKPCYFEDNDTHSMMKIHGLKALNLQYAPYYHYGSMTQNSVRGGVCTPPQFMANRRYFIRKFGSTPEGLNIERAKKRLGMTND